jgi:hypothetical protein
MLYVAKPYIEEIKLFLEVILKAFFLFLRDYLKWLNIQIHMDSIIYLFYAVRFVTQKQFCQEYK